MTDETDHTHDHQREIWRCTMDKMLVGQAIKCECGDILWIGRRPDGWETWS